MVSQAHVSSMDAEVDIAASEVLLPWPPSSDSGPVTVPKTGRMARLMDEHALYREENGSAVAGVPRSKYLEPGQSQAAA